VDHHARALRSERSADRRPDVPGFSGDQDILVG
jgi:hypothetical protein